jgi:hypothetical protein
MIASSGRHSYPRVVSPYWQNALILAVTFGAVWHLAWHSRA